MKTGIAALDECYVFTHRADTKAVVEAIKQGLTNDGLSDLVRGVVLPDATAGAAVRRAIQRREALRTLDIALPQVMWREDGVPARQIDPESDLHPLIDWSGWDAEAFANGVPADARAATACAAGDGAMSIPISCSPRSRARRASGSWRWSRKAISWPGTWTVNTSASCWRRYPPPTPPAAPQTAIRLSAGAA